MLHYKVVWKPRRQLQRYAGAHFRKIYRKVRAHRHLQPFRTKCFAPVPPFLLASHTIYIVTYCCPFPVVRLSLGSPELQRTFMNLSSTPHVRVYCKATATPAIRVACEIQMIKRNFIYTTRSSELWREINCKNPRMFVSFSCTLTDNAIFHFCSTSHILSFWTIQDTNRIVCIPKQRWGALTYHKVFRHKHTQETMLSCHAFAPTKNVTLSVWSLTNCDQCKRRCDTSRANLQSIVEVKSLTTRGAAASDSSPGSLHSGIKPQAPSYIFSFVIYTQQGHLFDSDDALECVSRDTATFVPVFVRS